MMINLSPPGVPDTTRRAVGSGGRAICHRSTGNRLSARVHVTTWNSLKRARVYLVWTLAFTSGTSEQKQIQICLNIYISQCIGPDGAATSTKESDRSPEKTRSGEAWTDGSLEPLHGGPLPINPQSPLTRS